MKEKIIDRLQLFAKAIIVPVLFLPIIGLILAFGTILGNPNIVGEGSFLINIGKFISQSLWPVMGNLNIIFCVGIAMGLAKDKKADAALIALLSFFVFLGANSQWLKITDTLIQVQAGTSLSGTGQAMVLGFQVIDMGVFLGMVLGVTVALVHNKFCKTELPGALNTYGNTKLVFIVLVPILLSLAVIVSYIWPAIASGITSLTQIMKNSGYFGVGLYGFTHKLLIPTGLHHLIWSPFSLTNIGGELMVAGELYQGYRNIFLAQLSDPSITYFHESAQYALYGMTKIFGLVGVSLAFYKTAKPENRNKLKAILIPATITSVLVGITEPLEFTFLFISPLLWVVHAILDGLFQALTAFLGVRAYATGGLIDFIVYNIPAGIARTRWPIFIGVGLVQLGIYYMIFKTLILKLNIKTPGREDKKEVKLYTSKDLKEKKSKDKVGQGELGQGIIVALGGKDNIESVENCFTRLRVKVKDINVIDEDYLKETGASGVVKKGNNVQVIYGPKVSQIRDVVDVALV